MPVRLKSAIGVLISMLPVDRLVPLHLLKLTLFDGIILFIHEYETETAVNFGLQYLTCSFSY